MIRSHEESELLARLPDATLLGLTAYLEARSEPVLGLVAVMWVVKNRVARSGRGRTVPEVVLWPAQFSSWNPSDPNYPLGLQAARFLLTTESATLEVWGHRVDGIVLATSVFLAGHVLAGHVPDPTAGATHYYAPSGVAGAPRWADPDSGARHTTTIGRHQFFTKVA